MVGNSNEHPGFSSHDDLSGTEEEAGYCDTFSCDRNLLHVMAHLSVAEQYPFAKAALGKVRCNRSQRSKVSIKSQLTYEEPGKSQPQ